MLSEHLGVSSIHLGVPFIAPRQLGAIGGQLGRPILPSVVWCTGQSGAPPDSYCSCTVLDFFPYGEQPTVGPRDRLAHRTVRCAQPTVGATMCRAKIAWPTIAMATVGSPDSPVILAVRRCRSPRAASSPGTSLAHWTLSCAPPDSPVCLVSVGVG
jgi:hypothetical protein